MTRDLPTGHAVEIIGREHSTVSRYTRTEYIVLARMSGFFISEIQNQNKGETYGFTFIP